MVGGGLRSGRIKSRVPRGTLRLIIGIIILIDSDAHHGSGPHIAGNQRWDARKIGVASPLHASRRVDDGHDSLETAQGLSLVPRKTYLPTEYGVREYTYLLVKCPGSL